MYKTKEEAQAARAKKNPRFAKLLKDIAADFIKTVSSNKTTRKIYDARMDICKKCDFFTKWKRCTRCGCFMNKKAQYEGASCPLGKWNIKGDSYAESKR